MIPEIKKELKSFILDEKGGAQKQILISLGALVVGMEAINLMSQLVSGAQMTSKHDHCDPGDSGHSSGHGSDASGWNVVSYTEHSSADGVPSSHCSSGGHGSSSGWHGSVGPYNVAHKNNIVLNYG